MIRSATANDASALAEIYNHFIRETAVTFEEEPVTAEVMATRLANVLALDLPWLVLEQNARILGYAYATRWKERSAYRYSVESTIYLAPEMTGQGHGMTLYSALIDALMSRAVHAVIGGISLPNPASIALHEKLGFRPVGSFREVGRKFERWIDVGYWQLLLKPETPQPTGANRLRTSASLPRA